MQIFPGCPEEKGGLMKRIFLTLVCLLSLFSFAPQSQARDAERLTFVSGPVGGDWYSLGGSIGEIVKRTVSGVQMTVTTGGGISNGPMIEKGKADMGLSQAMLYHAQENRLEPYAGIPEAKNLSAIGYVGYVLQAYFLVKDDSPLKSIEQMIQEKYPVRMVLTTRSATPELAVRRLLAEYGVTYKDIESWGGKISFVGFAEAEGMISDDHCDVYVGPVLGAIVQMVTTNKMRLLPWKESVIDEVCRKYAYDKQILPKGKYDFVEKDTPCMAESNIILVRRDMSDDLVYNITRAICENADTIRASGPTYINFDPRRMVQNVGGAFHPGAERYFREQGWIK